MNKTLLSILALSLAGNLAFAVFSFGPIAPPAASSGSAAGTAKTSAATAAGASAAPAGDAKATAAGVAPGFTWSDVTPASDLHAAVAKLRAAGFPPKAIAALLYTVLSERIAANDPTAALPYWQRNNPPRKLAQEREAAYKAMRDEIKDLLGADAASLDPAEKAHQAQRYGNISEAKIEALRKIESDYSDIRRTALDDSGMMTPERYAAQKKQQAQLEQEKRADLAALLSPEELQQYELRNSQTASTVMRNIRNLEVTEQEYTALYALQKAYDEANPTEPNTPAGYAQRNVAQAQLRDQVQGVLTDDRFYSYLAKTDYNYVRTQEFTAQYPTLTAANTYELSKISQEVQAKLMDSAGTNPSADRATLLADYTARVTTLLGPDATEAYKKSNVGRWMRTPAPRPAKISPSGP